MVKIQYVKSQKHTLIYAFIITDLTYLIETQSLHFVISPKASIDSTNVQNIDIDIDIEVGR